MQYRLRSIGFAQELRTKEGSALIKLEDVSALTDAEHPFHTIAGSGRIQEHPIHTIAGSGKIQEHPIHTIAGSGEIQEHPIHTIAGSGRMRSILPTLLPLQNKN